MAVVCWGLSCPIGLFVEVEECLHLFSLLLFVLTLTYYNTDVFPLNLSLFTCYSVVGQPYEITDCSLLKHVNRQALTSQSKL